MHAPHCPWSQPFLGLVLPSRSRSASNSVIRVSIVSRWSDPSTPSVMSAYVMLLVSSAGADVFMLDPRPPVAVVFETHVPAGEIPVE